MTQKLFNKIIGILFLIKAIAVGHCLLIGIKVVAFFGVVESMISILIIIFSLSFAYIAFRMGKKQKYITQKLLNQIFGTMSGFDAFFSLYYLIFNAKMLLGNRVFITCLLMIIIIIDIYLFYTAFRLAKKIK